MLKSISALGLAVVIGAASAAGASTVTALENDDDKNIKQVAENVPYEVDVDISEDEISASAKKKL
ncbi:hypothetical protein ATL39_1251 [Sinobaca qinghaiensis]|uniref:Uncharacterized protein n=1 Tax=Sinobaca qinghaiensis TaxID=342944 RepID=A0A419V6S6_9BACL|nr:hypothetical protein [Sinobaca qinghaiensis]RKD75551.1 hypothetical protein ATL39_1251 [Sinobaca qinghaiensis]